MRRRAFVAKFGASVGAVGSGCLGGGGEVVVSVSRSITVEPGRGWTREIPDVSDPGGAVSYAVKSDERAFDVYFFVEDAAYESYRAFVDGEDPDETPRGHAELSKSAVDGADDGMYEATTSDDGARDPLDATGPYHFVLDHSSYRLENRVEETDEPLSAFVDLTVVRNHAGL